MGNKKRERSKEWSDRYKRIVVNSVADNHIREANFLKILRAGMIKEVRDEKRVLV